MSRFAIVALLACSLCAAQTSTTPKSSTPAKPQSGSSSQSSTGQKPASAGQTPAAGAVDKTATPATKPAADVPETAAVVTINGACDKPDASGQCKTVITRADFERLTSALNPQSALGGALPPEAKRQIAMRYSQVLAVADEAKKQKLDTTPQAQELQHWAQIQALAQAYMNNLQKQSIPSDAEIQKYYDDNRPRFEKITVERILVPGNPGPDAKGVTQASLKETAKKIYDRAKAGEDFNKLQKEAFTAAGIPTAPDAKMVVNPASLPPSQASVRQLKPGEISPMFSEVSGEYIYKMVSSEVTPLATVRPEIEKALQRQKFEEAARKMLEGIKPDLNEAYFGPAPKQGVAPERD